MHLMISHASALEPHFEAALRELELPALSHLLGLLGPPTPGADVGDDELTLLPPHERALAQLRGLPAPADGPIPLGAWRLRELRAPHAGSAGAPTGKAADNAPHDGSHRASAQASAPSSDHGADDDTDHAAWALLTPLHLSVGTDQVTAMDPAALELDEAESRAFLEALSPVFPADEGWRTQWLAADQWAIAHDTLEGLPSASLDRIVNRGVETWMPKARRLRTLLNEIQMVLHNHPLNDAREGRRLPVLNAAWISGCGRDGGQDLPTDLILDDRLRAPMHAGDLYRWSEAWKALDAGPLTQALRQVREGGPLRLTLSGERLARTWERRTGGAWQRLRERLSPPQVRVADALGAL
ncbi:hypothetical protein [Roseateles amylovorans]|uniref:Phosphoglycerate mutase n=1 Tax=Roseateles amylovorans TaxID=2978473 RepID=A0ABY6B3L8_9BURK|nr:hypothetical protein [Roseateles amylovorans]UXH79662.1 hypothetical protein N4261_07045 [Roseateles amylovorans]